MEIDKSWLDNKVINKTQLACAIWSDIEPDVKPDILRKRLEQKLKHNTLNFEETNAISFHLFIAWDDFKAYLKNKPKKK